MATLTQKNRQLAVETPLGEDVLLLTAFTGHEEVSRLFRYQLEMLSPRDDIKPSEIVGKNATFQVRLADGKPRHFNGIISRFTAGSRETGLRRYFAEVVPWLWLLTRTADCRIFQNKSVPEIVQQIFKDLSFSPPDFDTSEIKGEHKSWEYCVQYRETDFNFVSRLLEQEGIFYYFRHQKGKHTLVLADQTGAYKDAPEKQVEYEYSYGSRAIEDRITRWEHSYEFIPGKWAQTDYNFATHPARTEEKPSKLLMANKASNIKLDNIDKYEIYDFPGEYETPEEGRTYTDIRMQEDEASHDLVQGGSTCKTFNPGLKFKITRHDCKAEEGKGYVITGIQHAAREPAAYYAGDISARDYSNTFTCIPDSVVFRPARITPKPIIQGSQTAVVVGPPGEEIWPDKYGRVKVQFFWDREGKRNENSSCWIRCMQASAGKGWGSMFIPRIGQEVVVSYLEGDPDRPLITGVVYNADQMPAYTLPDEKTKSYVKTNSSKDGKGFNELRFEDAQGKEQIFVHAQRNMDVRVLNEEKERVLADRHLIVGNEKDGKKGGDQLEMVYQDKHLKVHRNHVEHIGGNMELLVGGLEGDGNQDIVIQGVKKEVVEKDSHVHVKQSRSEKVDADQSLIVGANQQEKIGMKHAVEAGQEIHLKAGMKVVLEAGLQLTIKAAGGFVDIGPAGVTIQGVLVNINSGGAAGVGSGSQPASAEDAKKAEPKEPAKADDSKTGQKSAPDSLS